ncbi:MAG: acyltransferase family protein [Duganella sp.]
MTQHNSAAPSDQHLKYRADIDGLRAIAVLAVVGFHAFPQYIRGGFIGVDIFFIISGFLISTIIFKNLDAGNFSIAEFYRRRVKRIFPALLLVLISCMAFGWFFLLADEYRQLGKHTAGGAIFISNILLWQESGYFDASADVKPLLHLWSLAVEEQFYIFWPLILAIAWKKKWNLSITVILLALLSFAVSVVYLRTDPTAAFYSPQSRFWELMMGSLLAYTALYRPQLLQRFRNVRSAAGFLLLAAGLLLINKQSAFPGWWALLPTVGACLIISAGPTALLNKKVLSSRLFVWFGLISYPLYLWHWPIFSFLHIVEGAPPARHIKLVAIVLSIVLAWLTYRLIERPVRNNTVMIARHSSVVFPLVMLVVGSAGYYCYAKDGLEGTGYRLAGKSMFADNFENSYPDWHYVRSHDILNQYREDCNFYDIPKFLAGGNTLIPRPALTASCHVRDKAHAKSVFIWGDSHAEHLNYGLKNHLPREWQILQVASSGCMPDANVVAPSTTDYCAQSNWFAMQSIRQAAPDVVLIAQSTGQSIDQFRALHAKLTAAGVKKVIFAGPVPHWEQALPKIVLRKLWENTPQRTFVGLDQAVYDNNSDLRAHFEA